MIIRYGATFPDTTVGKGRNKVTFKDFNNLVYELNACDSFNLNLIKGIAKEHFEPLSKKAEKVKLLSVESKTSATFQFKKRGVETKTYTLAMDFDDVETPPAAYIEQARLSGIEPNILYYSYSHQPDSGKYRFRLVWCLQEAISAKDARDLVVYAAMAYHIYTGGTDDEN